MRKQKKNSDLIKIAKSSDWAVDAFLINKLRILPASLIENSLDNLFKEEKRFLFYLDAHWGRVANEMQLVHILESEIDNIIAEDSTPEGIKKSTQRMLDKAVTQDERNSLLIIMKQTEMKRKTQKIEDVFDQLKDILGSEDLISFKKNVNVKLRKDHEKKLEKG